MRDPRHHNKCKATEGHASLLFARRHDIRKIALDHNEMTSIVNNTKSATALDYVFRTGMIFWSDVTEQKIYKAPIDEGNERTAVVRDLQITADGLAVDWIYNHIYYSDTKRCTIDVTNFDGTMSKVLIEDDLEIPRALALDPINGWMYWTDWGSNPRIERAGMDGSHRKVIVNSNVKWANGITLDLVLKRVYWVDAKLNIISSCNYDGTDRRVILYSSEYLRHPFSITTFEDWVYWTDWDKAAVFKANKFTGEEVQAITAMRMVRMLITSRRTRTNDSIVRIVMKSIMAYLINILCINISVFVVYWWALASASDDDTRVPSVSATRWHQSLPCRKRPLFAFVFACTTSHRTQSENFVRVSHRTEALRRRSHVHRRR